VAPEAAGKFTKKGGAFLKRTARHLVTQDDRPMQVEVCGNSCQQAEALGMLRRGKPWRSSARAGGGPGSR
jgi:hypothetical protein